VPRKASIRYFKSRGAYYTQLRGRQYKLATGPDDFPDGPTYKEAWERYWQLLSIDNVGVAGDTNTVRTICEAYLAHVTTRLSAGTVKGRLQNLRPFVEFDGYGELPVRDLTPHHAYRFFGFMAKTPPERTVTVRGAVKRVKGRPWGDSTVATVSDVLKAAFNWAAKTRLITRNPLQGLEVRAIRSRGREALLGNNAEEIALAHRKILAASPPSFRPFLTVLEATGARPAEIANATATDFDASLGALTYHAEHTRRKGETSHKTGGKGKTRTIILTGEALAIVRERVERYPSGPLFRGTSARRPKLSPSGVAIRFARIRQKVGMPHLTAYSYRHTFATEWLKAGKSIDVLAALLGNSPAIIRKHYSHLLADPGALRLALESFRGGTAGKTQTPSAGPDGVS
jgi:integrase